MPTPGPTVPHDPLNTAFSAAGLRQAVRRGSRRTLFAQIASHVASLVILATLYHWVTPGDFGLFGMVMPVVLLLRIFTPLGMNIATVQMPTLRPQLVSTLFWMHLMLGAATALAAVALAPAVAWFYDEADARPVMIALAATSLASAVGLQHIALLERNLRLGEAAVCRLVGQVVGGVVAIGMALAGYGVWCLVAQQYVELLALAVTAWWLEPWRPVRPRAGDPLGHALHLGSYYTASQFIMYLLANVDKVLVGYTLGREALGFYSQAFNVMMKPVVVLTTPLSSVMLPALSRSVHDRESYSRIVLVFQHLLAVASFPAAIGLSIVARDTMLVLGGEAWNEAGRLLGALAITVLVQGFINMAGALFVSAGHWRGMFVGLSVMLIVLVEGLAIGLALGRRYGEPTLGVAWGYSLTTCLALFLPFMVFCLRLIGVSPWEWARQMVRPALATLAMGAVVLAVERGLAGHKEIAPLARLVIEVSLGMIVYAVLMWRDVRWYLDQLRRL